MKLSLLSVVFVVSSFLFCAGPVHATFFDISFPTPITTQVGETVDIPVMIGTDIWGGPHIDFTVTTNSSQLEIISVKMGAGLRSYTEAHGNPTLLDFTQTVSTAYVDGVFSPGYDSTVHGTEFIVVTCQVVAGSPGSSTVSADGIWAYDPAYGIVLIEEEIPSLLRGDLDGDAACNVTDAILILRALFVPGETLTCYDAADMDDGGVVNLMDVAQLLAGLFGGANPLPETCGEDTTADQLPPCHSSSCP